MLLRQVVMGDRPAQLIDDLVGWLTPVEGVSPVPSDGLERGCQRSPANQVAAGDRLATGIELAHRRMIGVHGRGVTECTRLFGRDLETFPGTLDRRSDAVGQVQR